MIRYALREADLWDRIDRHKPTWRARAEAATQRFRRAGTYGEPPSPFWGEIKAVYMRLQKNKCAFCERKLTVRLKDHDVEHFRPKRAVAPWPPPGDPEYSFPTGQAFPEGYFRLAYHPLNYATACEHCNRGLKCSYFPIEGSRMSGADNPAQLASERPLLLYPLGQIDADPEDLLTFVGTAPSPKAADPDTHEHHRARVTIDFFDLAAREELLRERSEIIESLEMALSRQNVSEAARRHAQKIIKRKTADGSAHASCARCFLALYRRDPERAGRLARLATDFLGTLV